MDTQQILIDNQNLLSVLSNAFVSLFRLLGWWLIRGISFLNDQLEAALQVIFANLDFFTADKVGLNNSSGGLYGALKPVFWALLTVGIIIVGYLLLTNRLKNKVNIPINLVIIVAVAMGLPTILNMLNNVTQAAVTSFVTDSSFMEDLVRNNVTDLAYIDANNFSAESIEAKNNFSTGSVSVYASINPTETIDYKKANNSEVFQSVLKIGTDGTITTEKKANKNFLGIELLDSLYYRYQINWMVLLVASFAIMIAFIAVGLKTVRNIFDIAYSAIHFLMVAPLDVSNGQRAKKTISEIINIFGVIILTLVLLQLYSIAMTWTAALPWLPALMFQVGFSGAMIGGPAIVQKTLGIDIGVGKDIQSMAGAMYMANATGQALKGGANAIGKAVSSVGGVAAKAGVAGAAAAGAASAGAKNSFEEFAKKHAKPTSSAGDYTIFGADRQQAAGAIDAPEIDINQPRLLGDGEGHATVEPGGISDQPIDPTGGDSPSGSGETIDTTEISHNGTHTEGVSEVPDAKRVTQNDTIGSAFNKWAGNTAAGKSAKVYGEQLETAFKIGQNTANKSWEDYRNQEAPIPHVYAESVDSVPTEAKRSPTVSSEPINVDAKDVTPQSGLPPKKRKE